MRRALSLLLFVAAAIALGWAVRARLDALESAEAAPTGDRPPVPVEVARLQRGTITLRRTFSGALEASEEFVAAPKVGGRLERLEVDLGDVVERGQVVAHLDDDELDQAVLQAEADLAVARASFAEAKSALEIAERALKRVEALRAEGVTSESQLDTARTDELARRAHVEVTKANVERAEAALESARIRLGYARVTADWSGGDDRRVVAERYVDEGGTISANAALLSIVELDPIVAVVHVPERDYARLALGQEATLTTDAWPGSTFAGRIVRIAPVFRRSTRQARVELEVRNGDERLKPGMFVRANLELERVEDALLVPVASLTEREGRTGIFLVDEPDGEARARWEPVEPGVREGALVELRGADLEGLVVTLGQELCEDGGAVSVVEREAEGTPAPDAPEVGATR